MTYGSDVFEKEVGYEHPVYGCSTETMNADEKCDAILELINQLEWRIEELEKNNGT
tara:strand:+ start:208 stop:375 length:168 start_codon:yes stop_codon:yes gene_type:complete